MKKIYAKTLNPEDFDYRIYDIREDEGNRIIIDGGREYGDIDNGELKHIKYLINGYSEYELQHYYDNSIRAYIKDSLYPLRKDNGKDFSNSELHAIKKAIEEEGNEEIITIVLSIIHGEPYTHSGLRGSCQGEYVEAYYPKSTPRKEVDYVEAWFFGTGTEVMIHDEDKEVENPDDIEGYTFYTSSWRASDIKEEVMEHYYGTSDEDIEVVLWLYDNSTLIRRDHYVRAKV